MTVRTLSSDFCLHFGGTRTMRSGDILLFLCLGLYLRVSGRLVLLWAATEGDAIKNYLTDIVSSWYHRLKSMMESVGFESIMHEWWHYNLKGWQNYPMVEWP